MSSPVSVRTNAVRTRTDTSFIEGDLTVPQDAVALVIFAHGLRHAGKAVTS